MSTVTSQTTFEALEKTIRSYYPKFKIISKRSSFLHRAIGAVLGGLGINKKYMTTYWTTIGATVAYPVGPEGHQYEKWSVLPHEGLHAGQCAKWSSFLMGSLYLLGTPVYLVLGLLFSLPFFLTSIWTSLPWWSGLFSIGVGLLLSSPVPFGYWRARWEFQAYGLSIAVQHWLNDDVPDTYINHLVGTFTGGDYFFMWPYKKSAYQKLDRYRQLLKTKKFFLHNKDYSNYYVACFNALKQQGRISLRAS